jgi:hypothetical protein
LKYDFNKDGHPDYTSYYTFNDDVIWENTHFLIQCYLALGEERFLDPIRRGMDFYLISQDGCGAWGQQLNKNMKTAGARTYEPAAYLPSATCENALLLLKFYQYTGDKKFLVHVPAAIKWLEETKLPADQVDGFRVFLSGGPKSTVKNGYFYQTVAEGGTAGPATSHMVVSARSKSPFGPWENSPYNPIVHTGSRAERW